MKIIRKTLIYTMILGIIAVSINFLFGTNTITYVEQVSINGFKLYKFDFWSYIENIRITFSNPSELQLAWQERTWTNVPGNVLQEQFWQAIINNLAYMLNCVIFAINLLIYPVRITMYLGRAVLSILGVDLTNTDGGLYWLVQTCNYMVELQIPYV